MLSAPSHYSLIFLVNIFMVQIQLRVCEWTGYGFVHVYGTYNVYQYDPPFLTY